MGQSSHDQTEAMVREVRLDVEESNRMQAALELQDDMDRRKVALTGYKEAPGAKAPDDNKTPRGGSRKSMKEQQVVSVDNRCLSCSGQTATVLAGFKIACLQYAPGQVKYDSKDFDRSELLNMRNELVEQAHEALINGPEGLSKEAKKTTFEQSESLPSLGRKASK